jgi:hypothetical protein
MLKLFNNKKGIAFTILAIFLSAMFFLLLSDTVSQNFENNIELTKTRSLTLSSYYTYLSSYVSYSAEMSAKACLSEISDYMKTKTVFFENRNNFSNNLKFCMLNSKISPPPTHTEIVLSNIHNLTLGYLLDELINLTRKDYNINTSYEIKNISLLPKDEQKSPNKIGIGVYIDLVITSNDLILNPETKEVELFFDVNQNYDPYHSLNIDEKNFTNIVLVGEDKYQNVLLEDFINNVSHVQLIGFGNTLIDRFINDSSIEDIGLISFINESVTLDNNVSFTDVSYVSGETFDCDKLYCQVPDGFGVGSCINDFQLDSDTFWTLQSTYKLNVSNWDTVC